MCFFTSKVLSVSYAGGIKCVKNLTLHSASILSISAGENWLGIGAADNSISLFHRPQERLSGFASQVKKWQDGNFIELRKKLLLWYVIKAVEGVCYAFQLNSFGFKICSSFDHNVVCPERWNSL